MNILIGAIILVVTASVSASPGTIEGRIFNGLGASEGEFPYMVRLQTLFQNKPYRCGGSLISSRWVLTAAHCIHMSLPFKINVFLGKLYSHDANVGYTLQSDAVHIHPRYDIETGLNDIALINIPETPLCDKISTVPLPPLDPAQHKTYLGEVGRVVGWGCLGDNQRCPDQLQFGRMRIIQNEACIAFRPWMSSKQICVDSSGPYSNTCRGDSGGPFVLESTGELVGVISSSTVCYRESGFPSIFTRVSSYLEWIKEKTGVFY